MEKVAQQANNDTLPTPIPVDDQISLGKAAELLEMQELELRDRFLELGIPLRLGAANLAEARAEVEAVRNWFAKPKEGNPAFHFVF